MLSEMDLKKAVAIDEKQW